MTTEQPGASPALSDQLGLLVDEELAAYYEGKYMDHSGVKCRLLGFARAVQAAERKRCSEDVDLLRQALLALTYHRDQTRPIYDSDAVIDKLRTRLWA